MHVPELSVVEHLEYFFVVFHNKLLPFTFRTATIQSDVFARRNNLQPALKSTTLLSFKHRH
jgi:hypothetical protein